MDNEQIFKLIEAGFTAEEIRGMAAKADTEAEGSVQPEQGAGSATHEGEVNPNQSDEIRELKAAILEINNTVKAIQDTNIKKAESTSASLPDQIQSHIESFIKEF